MALTQKQIDDLNKVINKLPMQRLIDYAQNGTFTRRDIDLLTELTPERRKALLAIIDEVQPGGIVEEPKPNVTEEPKPNVTEEPKPDVVEKPKPEVADKPKPDVVEKPKPVIVPPLPTEFSKLGIVALWEWLGNNSANAHYDRALQFFQELKARELEMMMQLPSAYPGEKVLMMLDKQIISEQELFDRGIATPESLAILREREDIIGTLPDINVEIAKCRKECAEGHTDVFLFGIPSTGKTCILMGFIGSPNIRINTVRAGGPYSCVLEQFLDAGLTIGQTPKDFVATIEAEIPEGKNKHLLNLVEMAGEDFAFKIADNENGLVSFEDIGVGATNLLCNNNKKVFFIIVDPTAKRVAFNHLVNETDADGTTRTYLVRKNVNQKIILKRLVDLLSQPENKSILRNVDSINIVITKSDVLGEGQEREDEAYRRFMEQHQSIVGPLIELCRENSINLATNGQPMLYTFSLGRFYVGGVYQYDPKDANKLIEVLKASTEATKKGNFGGKFKEIFN